MRTTRIRAGAFVVAFLIAVPYVWAQDTAQKKSKTTGPAGATRPATLRSGAWRGGRARGFVGGLDLQRLQKQMAEKLKLSDGQKAQVAKRIKAFRDELKTTQDRRREHLTSVKDQRLKLAEKIKAARDADDRDALQAAYKEMRDLIGRGPNVRQLQEKLMDDVRAIVPADQRQQFDEILERIRIGRSRRGYLARLSPKRLVQAAETAKLPQEKIAKLKSIVEAYEKDRKNVDSSDRRARAERRMKFQKDVAAALTPDEQDSLILAASPRRNARGKGRPGK